MPRDAFHTLPLPDRKKFVAAVEAHLRTALESLSRFSRSMEAGKPPKWPTAAELSLFMRQIEAFRLISTRSSKARPIHLIHEMNHRWEGLQIVATLDRLLDNLELYIGRSLLAEANAQAIKLRADPRKREWHSLIFRMRNPKPGDLHVMTRVLPTEFQAMMKLIDRLRQRTGVPPHIVENLDEGLARCAQEYLFTKHQLYIAKLQLARSLREFIYELKHPPYSRRLHGFAPEHVETWDKAERRERVRERVQRFRDAKKSAG